MSTIAEYQFNTSRTEKYSNNVNDYFTYSLSANSTDNQVFITAFYPEVFDASQFIVSWIIQEKANNNNQISFTGNVPAGQNGKFAVGTVEYGVKGILGDKWKDTKKIEVETLQNGNNKIKLLS